MRWSALDIRSLGVGLAYLAPALFIFVVFVFIPLGRTFYLSFYNTRSTGVITTFNGIDHYIDLVTSATFRHPGVLAISVAPVVLGAGKLLFDGFTQDLDLEKVSVHSSPWATHTTYDVRR